MSSKNNHHFNENIPEVHKSVWDFKDVTFAVEEYYDDDGDDDDDVDDDDDDITCSQITVLTFLISGTSDGLQFSKQ